MNYVDNEIKKSRILDNLEIWETITKYRNQPYNIKVAKMIKENTLRLLIKSKDPTENEKIGFLFGKHFVNSGISPSQIVIISLEDCYNHIRGFGESLKIKEKIFNKENKVIIITDVEDIKVTQVADNVSQFWEDFTNYILKYNINSILCFNNNLSTKWFFSSPSVKSKIKKLGFKEI